LTTENLSASLKDLAAKAGELARHLASNGDMPAAALAGGYVEAIKLQDRLAKLGKQLGTGSGGNKK